jgi:hypothetical protein
MHPMTAGRVVTAVGAAAALLLAGCGNSGNRSPAIGKLPLAAGSKVVAQVRQCDKGKNSYCSVELVIVNHGYGNSWALVSGERRSLSQDGWTQTHADTGDEHAAQSPGDKLRVTYATAMGDLKDVELGWITRSHAIAVALSHTIFERASAMSVLLELGPA